MYSLQLCVDIAMDVVAMLTKDIGIVVEDDYTNIQRLLEKGVISEKDAELLRKFNGLRNVIVHKYDRLDLKLVREGLHRVDELYEVLIKLVECYERISS